MIWRVPLFHFFGTGNRSGGAGGRREPAAAVPFELKGKWVRQAAQAGMAEVWRVSALCKPRPAPSGATPASRDRLKLVDTGAQPAGTFENA